MVGVVTLIIYVCERKRKMSLCDTNIRDTVSLASSDVPPLLCIV